MKSPARRTLMALLALGAASPRLLAQRPGKVPRIGWIASGSSEHPEIVLDVIRALRALGYRDGDTNLYVLFAEGRRESLDAIAAELVAMKPDVIFAGATAGTMAVQRATSTIPVVFAGVSDPVGAGFVRSLARPGGNVTGISSFGVDTASKLLEVLRQVVPKARRFGLLASENPGLVPAVDATQAAAQRIGIEIRVRRAETLAQIEAAFAAFRKEGIEALLVASDTPTILDRVRMAELAAAARLPAIYSDAIHVEDGGLMSYGPDPTGSIPQVVGYMDRILNGARPGDLAVQGPSEFELALNLDAARALGISFPRELVLRANKVVGTR